MSAPKIGKQRSYVGPFAKGDVTVRGYTTDYDPEFGSRGSSVGNFARYDQEQGLGGTGKGEIDTTLPMTTDKATYRGRKPSYGKQGTKSGFWSK